MNQERKTAIITGAAQGIGKAIALHLAGAGINIVISDINEEKAKQTALEVEKKGVNALV
ncbi:MAG: SDR family NAD(P)-dependent oxidoreductase, partial [Calditrichaceae bacterium]